IIIKGTTTGTQTDFDGNYNINASVGDVLTFSYVGFLTVEQTVGVANTINVSMQEDAEELAEVIVTAQGIKREKQALGYAVSEVSSDEISERASGDIARILSGKASGVNITPQSGVSGSGTSVVIRGFSTFSGSNQPLFIVDGVPFASDTNSQGNFVNGNNGSSRFLDIDPNSIENVSVLKGLAAATLYGTQGRNGVILITTKGGSSAEGGPKKTEISVSSSIFFNEISSLPDYQNEYGGGFDQAFGWFFSNWGPAFSEGGPGGWGNSSAFDANGTLEHPYSTASLATGIPQAFPEFAGARYAWRPYDSVKDFFRTGVVKNTSINIRSVSDDGKLSFNANYGNLDDQGFTPGNTLRRSTLGLGGRAELSNNFTVSGTLNFTRTNFESPPVAASFGSNVGGSNASIYGNLFYTPRSIDIQGLPFQNPITGESTYYRQNNSIQHPLWTVKNAKTSQLTNRVFGNLSLAYKINENLNFRYTYGLDVYSENNTNSSQKGGKTGSTANRLGVYQTWNNTNTVQDHNFNFSADYDLNEDFDVSAVIGATSKSTVYDRNGVASSGQQVFGVLRHFNFADQDEIQFSSEQNILGLYGQAEIGYQKFVYLTLAGRKDWVSNLSTENRSIFYPSASISFLPSKIIDALKDSNIVNYLKLRAGYGTSANFPGGYPISSTLNLDTQDFQDSAGTDVVTNSTGSVLGNTNLKPETISELEFGIETRLFNNRVTLDASVYSRITKDLIINRPLDPSTGYTSTRTNIGEIQNDGIEIDLGIDIFQSNGDGFNWNTSFNWSKSEAVVNDLGLDTDVVVYAGFTNLGNAAMVGESLGTMVGSAIARDDNGNLRVNAAGSYVTQTGLNIIGDANPDFILNMSNSISYKNFNLGFLFHWTEGGDLFSYSIATPLGRGVVTQEGVDRQNSFILPGVNPLGQPNTTQINNSTYYFSNVLYGPDEMLVYDATVFRLQEVSLGYSVPAKFLDKTPFGSINVTFSGYNLWFDAPNIPDVTNFDPNVAGLGIGNGRGFEYLNGPSSKRYGLSIKATF
ncbi:SusC/RagA family TonB-linked outer membrane protein, partial [Flavobacteriaceae bacterium AH-315-B10]|nr:SusC/RagA family TonB-linked outer membrane protein [Flavobacteriaceae bacterium AH-315-B10]